MSFGHTWQFPAATFADDLIDFAVYLVALQHIFAASRDLFVMLSFSVVESLHGSGRKMFPLCVCRSA